MTHGISGGFLSYDTFKAEKDLQSIDECHYTHDAAIVYTYVHFSAHVSMKAITSFMDRMKTERNIIPFEICGYASIATWTPEADLTDHIGFKVLISHFQTNNPAFSSCTDGQPGITKGLFWKYDSMSRLKDVLSRRSKNLLPFLEQVERENLTNKTMAETIELMKEQLAEYQTQNQRCRERMEELARYKFTCHVLKSRIRKLDQKTQEMLLKEDHIGRPLVL